MYFADVDPSKDILTVYEATADSKTVFEKLKHSEDYLATDKFDFIKFSQEYVTSGRRGCTPRSKWWGKCEHSTISQLSLGRCLKQTYTSYYFLGMHVDVTLDPQTIDC